jgi:SAM-dependent methyltransferase
LSEPSIQKTSNDCINSRYRDSELERQREKDLIRLIEFLPKGLNSVLEIGARSGHHTRLLTKYFESVTALDLECPNFKIDRVVTVKGDTTCLNFQDNAFDCVFCTEVLEHISEVEKACYEILRVAKQYVIIGVPYKQDIRVGRTTCLSCGLITPPWGHVNTFDEFRLKDLFRMSAVELVSYVGMAKSKTNCLSVWLLDLAGNPWGYYNQNEPCVHCGKKLVPPTNRNIFGKICSKIASWLARAQACFSDPAPIWLHMVFKKAAHDRLR